MKKQGLFIWILSILLVCSCGCGRKKLPAVTLSVWCDEQYMALTQQMVEEFKTAYKDEAVFDVRISAESEMTCKDTILSNPQKAADVFTFPDDQFDELYRNQALMEITLHKEQVIEACGGAESGAIASASREGRLYAYPKTAGNGYFLYYNKAYFQDEDIRNFNTMLELARSQGKRVSMDFSSGWYLFSFFKGAGLEVGLKPDGVTNYCNWNSTTARYKGVEVAQALLDISCHEGFLNCGDEQFLKSLQEGSVIAGVNGPWNASKVQEILGDDFGVSMLPKYMLAGDEVQMCSFTGYKLVGVNAHSLEGEWAMRLAEWITNEENQKRSFEMTKECPANVRVAQLPMVQEDPVVAALAEQSRYGYTQCVAESFWSPTFLFGTVIGNGNSDHEDLQELLDHLVENVTQVPVMK